MQETVITYATPVFFALIALELLWGWYRGRRTYRLNDAVTSIGLGVLSQVSGVFTRVLRIGIYAAIFQYVAIGEWPATAWWALPAAVLFYDFCYYWQHRWMHRISAMWAAHVVHHSSEDYNLSTALRQPSTGALLGWIPYLPMAILGVPPALFGIAALIDLLYQFWIHTEHVPKLGWFDRIFASPSNHRVHHAVNDRYVDRNYGGILIIWDRLFGTFVEERDDDPVVYGTRAPLKSFNPLSANFEIYRQLARDSWLTRRWRDKLLVWLKPPGWRPADLAAKYPKPAFAIGELERFDPVLPRPVGWYAVAQFALQLGFAIHFLQLQRTADTRELLSYLLYIVISLIGIGGLLEARRGFVRLEIARHALMLIWVAIAGSWFGLGPLPAPVRAAAVLVFAASLAGAWLIGRRLDDPAPISVQPA